MNVRIKRVDKELRLPQYETDGAVAFDFYCRVETTIQPHTVEHLPANIIVEVPTGMMLLITSRSSTPKRTGLMVANGVGTIDQDYCGDEDELKIAMYNTRDVPVTVARGERIAQGILLPIHRAEFEEVDHMSKPSRGGFGTTGTSI